MSTERSGDGQDGTPAIRYAAIDVPVVHEPMLLAPAVGVPRRPAYTLFVDENGHATLKNLGHRDNRYLCLTGVACAVTHEANAIRLGMDDLKLQHFGTQNVVLHCEDIKRHKGEFEALEDAGARRRFDGDILRAFGRWEYTVFSVLLDKQKLVETYGITRYDPYHYALEVLLEGYVPWLDARGGLGDVVTEARGGNEDRQLKAAFHRLWHDGTEHLAPERLQARLTSPQIKISQKKANVPGLQLTDLLAHPSFACMRAKAEGQEMRSIFGRQVVSILEASRYYRVDGAVDGSGRKWLP